MSSLPASPSFPHTARAGESFLAGRFRDTVRHATKAVRAEPLSCNAPYWLARAHFALGEFREALPALHAALQRWPHDEGLLTVRGMTLMKLGDPAGARRSLRQCVDRHPRSADAWTCYAVILQEQWRWEEARLASLMALALAPDNRAALNTYGRSLKETGQPELAIAAVRRAIALSPDDITARSLLAFLLLMCDEADGTTLRDETAELARLMARQRQAVRTVTPRPPDPRLRLGILSNDIRRHACAYFLVPLLAALDHTRVETVVIRLNGEQDGVTAIVAGLAERMVDVAGRAEADVVAAVRAEGLDALIDLGGYTGVPPLRYMVHGLAPVQLSWLGFPGGTGMPEVPYRVSDRIADPPGNDAHYTETLLRAPGTFAAYAPLVQDPLRVYQRDYQVGPTPGLRTGAITFGSCNNIGKLTHRVLRLWQAVLARCPGSRLLVEAIGLEQPPVRDEFLRRLAGCGIAAERITLVPLDRRRQYLAYHDIDIVLDTAPFTGGTTTCDALWMGVPIVSRRGQAFHERMTASYLHAIGLDWLACDSDEAYVEAAVQLAADVAELDALRQSIRPRIARSAVSDAAGFAAWLEETLAGLVARHRPLQLPPSTARDGVTFDGAWLDEAALGDAIARLLAAKEDTMLRHLLERMSARWSSHWMVAFALAMQAHRGGDRERSMELLMTSIGLHGGHLPLYRLLAAWLHEAGMESGWLVDLARQQCGAHADLSGPAPAVADILPTTQTREPA